MASIRSTAAVIVVDLKAKWSIYGQNRPIFVTKSPRVLLNSSILVIFGALMNQRI